MSIEIIRNIVISMRIHKSKTINVDFINDANEEVHEILILIVL